ncbi:hypothetical protein OIU84_002004 [Salix udensis]|uniref:Uncharacterized protein n=1 Tax=Salix udensis TaxID=889485 RepID=A0AAD6P6P7_9ROSI|nr:hypothetical protein OIU84_002004 [Salix udensis]
MRGALDGFLLSTSPVFVSAATFAACYFMETLLRASKVFIFVSTYVLLEKQLDMSLKFWSGHPSKGILNAYCKFLEAPDLQSGNGRERAEHREGEPCCFNKVP